MKKSVFADLKVTRLPQKTELEIYAEDKKILTEFWDFKQKQMGGDIPFAEVFSRLVRVVLQDTEFCAASPTFKPKKTVPTVSKTQSEDR